MKMMCVYHFNPMCFVILQKLSALSASLARVVSAEDEEAEVDQFPVEEVRKWWEIAFVSAIKMYVCLQIH